MTVEPVERFFAAMQAMDEEGVVSLFAENGVYVEPFSGAPREHRGRDAVRAAFRAGWAHPLPDQRIVVDRVDVEGDTITAAWTCHSPALPGGRGSGTNVFVLAAGHIARLETRLG